MSLAPGWYVQITGHPFDLDAWRRALNEPFDPIALEAPNGDTLVRSSEFQHLENAEEVRERGKMLVARLNGVMKLFDSVRPVSPGGVVRVDDEGKQHTTMFAEGATFEMRTSVVGVAVVLDKDGNPVPPSPPQPSAPQKWNELAEATDDLSDLLDHFGRADNWYDIYKTIEFAEVLAGGGEADLLRLANGERARWKNLKRNANYYRHAKADPPREVLTLREAQPLLSQLVRTVVEVTQKNGGTRAGG